MCGIAGIFSTDLPRERVETSIHLMQESLLHRGPDGKGLYVSNSQPVALAHTRLSILDLSSAGHQPMSTPDGRYWISFNGEIYNFKELRTQLEAAGDVFQTHTDTEVLLRLYQRYGKDCLQRLRGMFAFAIWDNHTETGFLARDPLGIKPLYYWQRGTQIAFASELRTLLAANLSDKQLSSAGLYGYLLTGSVPEPYTLVEDIRCLPAGTWLEWQSGQSVQQEYWQVCFNTTNDRAKGFDHSNQVRQSLLDSIRAHYVSDVPVGVFLSGGIDSTAIVALSREVHKGELHTYSIAFEDPDWNEGDLARRVSQQFGTHHTEHLMTPNEGRELFPAFLSAIDQPSVDGFNSFCVSKIARDRGQKVVLSGLGGDELFAGYKSFQQIPKMLRWGQLATLNPFDKAFASWLSSSRLSSKWQRIGDYLHQPSSISAAHQSFRGIFSHAEALSLLNTFLPEHSKSVASSFREPVEQPSLADNISALEISRYMRNQLLRDSDTMSMAWGLELRVPFVDSVLLDGIASIPSDRRLAYGKCLLVEAVPEVPDWIVNRPKKGFRFPFDQWFSSEWSNSVEEFSYPTEISLTPWYRRWSLIVLQHWIQNVLL